ncbi:MAG: hypothetical protein CVV05_13025 [Gammaproteobacteria bacterium HGW-Gammaproteobacteria-1]|nr:MAG: hypothetical protein CVV05_13025 [Gammaproteobacteria bacterium HGW-Gammaproteobacteria-1]
MRIISSRPQERTPYFVGWYGGYHSCKINHSKRDGNEFEAVVCEECLIQLASEWPTAMLQSNAASYADPFSDIGE